MVRAILSGKKTQTRRAVKPMSWKFAPRPEFNIMMDTGRHVWLARRDGSPSDFKWLSCPYGQAGDRLWVRETWMPDPPINDEWCSTVFHGTRNGSLSLIPECYRKPWHTLFRASWAGHELVGWRPSIHMPRWASRITLEITEVRVDRLQAISNDDAGAEGVDRTAAWLRDEPVSNLTDWRLVGKPRGAPGVPVERFARLWESINGAGSWAANPWVWVVEFRRLET